MKKKGCAYNKLNDAYLMLVPMAVVLLFAGVSGGWWLHKNYQDFLIYAEKYPSNTAALEYLGVFGKEKKTDIIVVTGEPGLGMTYEAYKIAEKKTK